MAAPNEFALVLAGGEGKRLWPLTADRAKPAVTVGGDYRLIDFALSNLANGEFRRIAVLTQYKSLSLDRHLATSWSLSPLLGNYVTSISAQMQHGSRGYSGSADAIYQSLNLIRDESPDYVLVFGADHIYRTDPRQMVAQHVESGACLTVAAIRFPIERAGEFGVIEVAEDGRTIKAFHEKPLEPIGLPDAPDQVLASMGNYVFDTQVLRDVVTADAQDESSSHDIGRDIIPRLVREGVVKAWDFSEGHVPGLTEREIGYWRDIGTLDAYYDAHMDLISTQPVFNLYNERWPILKRHERLLPPAKFVHQEQGRIGMALDSMVCSGVVVSGGVVRRSILSPGVRVHSRAEVDGSVLLHGVDVGHDSIIRNAIVDKGARIAPGVRIGVDPESDRERFHVSAGGIVVIGKGAHVEA